MREANRVCRICLTRNSLGMTPLDTTFDAETNVHFTIYDAIERLWTVKVPRSGYVPTSICAKCYGLLKVSCDLRTTFDKSQVVLAEHSRIQSDNDRVSVELIVGENRYNLTDVVVVEEEESDDDNNYNGFLRNLGETLTVEFPDGETDMEEPNGALPEVVESSDSALNIDEYVAREAESSSMQLHPQSSTYDIIINDDGQHHLVVGETTASEVTPPTSETYNSVNSGEGQEVEQYACGICNKIFSSHGNARRHITAVHTKRQRLHNSQLEEAPLPIPSPTISTNSNHTCNHCDASFPLVSQLRGHVRGAHQSEKQSLLCQACGHLSATVTEFTEHMIAHGRPQFKCTICPRRFKSADKLNHHRKSHNKFTDGPRRCPVCRKRFIYATSYAAHMKTHASSNDVTAGSATNTDINKSEFGCVCCEKRFKTATSLRIHMRGHFEGDAPDLTPIESANGTTTTSRNRTISDLLVSTSHPGKSHKCVYCAKEFTSVFALKQHQMQHPGKFACNKCALTFTEANFLKMHTAQKHKSADNNVASSSVSVNTPKPKIECLTDFSKMDSSQVAASILFDIRRDDFTYAKWNESLLALNTAVNEESEDCDEVGEQEEQQISLSQLLDQMDSK